MVCGAVAVVARMGVEGKRALRRLSARYEVR
jgi:hypothetical protein